MSKSDITDAVNGFDQVTYTTELSMCISFSVTALCEHKYPSMGTQSFLLVIEEHAESYSHIGYSRNSMHASQ